MGFYFRSVEAAARFREAFPAFELEDATDQLQHLEAERGRTLRPISWPSSWPASAGTRRGPDGWWPSSTSAVDRSVKPKRFHVPCARVAEGRKEGVTVLGVVLD